jgi:rhamnulose-1-phosphate aldolase/alcohol dehydrogenase
MGLNVQIVSRIAGLMNMHASIAPATPFAVPTSRWDDAVAATLSPAEQLLYRSNLLGSDLTVTNFGGGNTSAKIVETDPLTGEDTEVLWVKGSGGDIGSMKLDGFATLYQDKLLGLETHYAGPDDAEALEFVGSVEFERLAQIGTSCPDHFLRTRIAPLTLDPARLQDEDYLSQKLVDYRAMYAAYYDRCARANSPAMRDSNPVVVLVPGVGRITFATDKTTARLAGEFYGNAINVMRGAESIGDYIGLDEQEAFDIEYWLLEEAKLQRMPAPKPMVGRIALVTGGAGGIGAATAARLLRDGACVMLADRDEAAVEEIRGGFADQFGKDVVRSIACDVTDEAEVRAAFDACAREFGGLDVLVANAGIASSAPIEQTTVELWGKNFDVLAQGYFLTAKHAWPLLKRMRDQGGTSVVFIGSKNAVAAAAGASAYASAKSAANHLARCLALEGAGDGIRVNIVNPDAVIRGSRIWDGDWRKERAGTHGIDAGAELEEHYRNRSMLKRDVLPEDIADGVFFFASDASAKSTGNMLNVDAGNAQAFTR